MATDNIGLAAAPRGASRLFPARIQTSGLKQGAAVCYDTDPPDVAAPSGDKATKFAGLIHNFPGAAGTVAGTDVELQRDGDGMGLLAASASCTRGVGLVIANNSGHLRGYVDGTDDQCDVVGTALVTKTAGAAAEAIPLNLDAFTHVGNDT